MSKLELPVVITPTRAELAARCHRRHFLADVLGKARYFSPSLEFGSVVHDGVASLWLSQRNKSPSNFHQVISDSWAKHKVESESLTQALAIRMIEDYAAKASIAGPFTNQGNFTLVDVEQRFELPFQDMKLSFQCDRIVHDIDQNWLVIVDTKTAQRLDVKWDRQWETSLQMKLYRAGAMKVFQTGGKVDVVIEGVLKHAPSDIRYYVCPEWSEGLLLEAQRNAYTIAALDRDIIESALVEKAGKLAPDLDKVLDLAVNYTPTNYFDCYSYGVECPFRRLCVADPDQRVPILKAEYFDIEGEY